MRLGPAFVAILIWTFKHGFSVTDEDLYTTRLLSCVTRTHFLQCTKTVQVYHLTTPRQYKSTQTRVDSLAIFKYKIISVSPFNYYCVRDPTDPNTSTGFYTVSTVCVWDVIFKMSSINPYFSRMIVRILKNLVH